jgi:SAM-dependent methyltransferase
MRSELVNHLDPSWGIPPHGLDVFTRDGDEVLEGVLRSAEEWYPILRGVPCFLKGALRPDLGDFEARHGLAARRDGPIPVRQAEQARTNVTFSDKWSRFRNYGLEAAHQAFLQGWYCKKLGLPTVNDLKAFYRDKGRILEIGPGSGFNTRFMAENTSGTVFAADISEAAYTTYGNTRHLPNCHVIQADLMDLPFADGYFDFVIADGVLHHTPDTRKAVEAVYRTVKPGGQFFFYVYRQMGPARRFCDEHIRRFYTQMTPDECYAACQSLTELGRELSRLNAKITLTKPIPILGIPAGTHDVQRLVYYNFVKCFWNDAFDYETNNMVNFDWYHPHNAWQHNEAEVTSWLNDLGVKEYQFNPANPTGLSVLLRKPVEETCASRRVA